MRLVPTYQRRPSPLHSARAGVVSAFCAALALVPLLYESPLVLAAGLAACVLAGVAAGVGGELARAARMAVPLAVLIVIINPLVYREGETLLFRGGEILGYRIEITLEALVYGGVAGLRLFVLAAALALFSACVDPDDLLRAVRRFSYRSALTASLATRLAPVLARDALRMSDAARCRPRPPRRGTVARATLAGALDRAVEVAAALELRGYASAGRPPRYATPWSRHDIRVALAAAAIAACAIGTRAAGAGGFEAYPTLELATTGADLAAVALLPLLALAPFAGAGARLGVAHA
ncbi:MAG TPA: energy-coupling factor transporter transmembrane component T [Thermoleophilaceae bacterium]|nr:energy-coupling factor transporter transmembrane component T [Thermoleophilaceae bacterium]